MSNSRIAKRGSFAACLIVLVANWSHCSAQAQLGGVTRIAAGYMHTCAVVETGAVECWGTNDAGQLGDGTYRDHSLPVPAVMTGNASNVAAGTFHTCAIVDGGLQCWGANSFGALGDGSVIARGTPTPTIGLDANVTAVAGGYAHTCAIKGGAALCWGANESGQVGTGSTSNSQLVPAGVDGIANGATDIAAGWNFSCAVVNEAAMCWGANGAGTLGNGTYVDSSVPIQVQGLEADVTRVSAGTLMACAIAGGSVKCWGSGMLGDGSFTGSPVPVAVVGLDETAIDVSVGNGFACAQTIDLAIHCWGDNGVGELGSGTFDNASTATIVPFIDADSGVIASGGGQTCTAHDGDAYCWGENENGQLGIGSAVKAALAPTPLTGLPSGTDFIANGQEIGCAISGGTLSCWGANNWNELGDGSNLARGTPAPVTGLGDTVTSVAVNYAHACAVSGGAAYCWGNNASGEIGDGSNDRRSVPVAVSGLDSGVSAITAGMYHSCAIVSGGAKCWGIGWALGAGEAAGNQSSPVAVGGLTSGVTAISAGAAHTCAVVNGGAKCWGNNSIHGLLGAGPNAPDFAYDPLDVVGLSSGVSAIAAGLGTTCAIANGGVSCWGYGGAGQLGNGQYMDSDVPVAVTGLDSGVLAISVGSFHACAMTTSGVLCWGDNGAGELGTDIPSQSVATPVAASTLPVDVSAISAGDASSCAIADGAALCWGLNSGGQLGTGGIPWRPSPQAVVAGENVFADGFESH